MKIYVACSLTHVPRDYFSTYVNFIHDLARGIGGLSFVADVKYALVNSDPQLAEKPWGERSKLCYLWDRQMVEAADLIVAEASFPSTGLGIELQIADTLGKPVIMIFGDHGNNRVLPARYENPDHSSHELQVGEGIVSLMALGLPAIAKEIEYSSLSDGIAKAVEAVQLLSRE